MSIETITKCDCCGESVNCMAVSVPTAIVNEDSTKDLTVVPIGLVKNAKPDGQRAVADLCHVCCSRWLQLMLNEECRLSMLVNVLNASSRTEAA